MNVRTLLIGLVVLMALVATAAPASLAAGTGALKAAASNQLYTGWNLVPYLGGSCAASEDAFAQLVSGGVLDVAWHHANDTKVWTSFDPGVPPSINDLNSVCPNDVLVLHVSADVVWNQTP